MEHRKYKTVSLRNVELLDWNVVNPKKNRVNLTVKKPVRIKPVKVEKVELEPTPPADSDFGISENDYLFYRTEGKFWVYPLSEQRHTLIKAILAAKDGILDGNEAFKILNLDTWNDTDKMGAIIGNINRTLKENKIPVRISTVDYQYKFVKRQQK